MKTFHMQYLKFKITQFTYCIFTNSEIIIIIKELNSNWLRKFVNITEHQLHINLQIGCLKRISRCFIRNILKMYSAMEIFHC